MEFTEKEKKELITIAEKHKVVQKLLEELESYKEDPAKMYFSAVNALTKAIAKDLLHFANGESGNCKVIPPGDFDALQKQLSITDKMFSGIKKGKEDIDPEAAELEKKLESDKSSTKAAI